LAVAEDDRVHRADALDLRFRRQLGRVDDEHGGHPVDDRRDAREGDRSAPDEPGLDDRRARHLADVLEAVEAREAPGAVDQRPHVAAALPALVEAFQVGALEREVGRGGFLDPDLEVLAAAGELLADAR